MSGICDISFVDDDDDDDVTWTQAKLPVKFGSLEFWRAAQLVPSALLASDAGSLNLVYYIVPPHLHGIALRKLDDAVLQWSKDHDQSPLISLASHFQKNLDMARCFHGS